MSKKMILHQVVALLPGVKSRADKIATQFHHIHKKPDLLNGLARQYRALRDGDETLPSESKRVEHTVAQSIEGLKTAWGDLWDLALTQERSNYEAKADIEVEGQVLLRDAPVPFLLFLTKQLTDLKTFIEEIPTLDPSLEWSLDSNAGLFRSETIEKMRSRKNQKPIVLYEATKEHPAQVQLLQVDENVGVWSETKLSGAIPATVKKQYLERVTRLLEAVVKARESGNALQVDPVKGVGADLLNFVFGS